MSVKISQPRTNKDIYRRTNIRVAAVVVVAIVAAKLNHSIVIIVVAECSGYGFEDKQ